MRDFKFGDRVMNPHASEDNPHKYSFFVEMIFRSGPVNKGRWYRCTDGNGNFWDSMEILHAPENWVVSRNGGKAKKPSPAKS